VASNGITFIPNFVKISPLVPKLQGRIYKEHGNVINLLLVFKKGK